MADQFTSTVTSYHRKFAWSKVEDEFLSVLVNEQISKVWSTKQRINWKAISDKFTDLYCLNIVPCRRLGKQCRERWKNYIAFSSSSIIWTDIEKNILFDLNEAFHNKWSKISKIMNRSENDVKNQFHLCLKKKISNIIKCNFMEITPKEAYQLVMKHKLRYNEVNSDKLNQLMNNETDKITLVEYCHKEIGPESLSNHKNFEPFTNLTKNQSNIHSMDQRLVLLSDNSTICTKSPDETHNTRSNEIYKEERLSQAENLPIETNCINKEYQEFTYISLFEKFCVKINKSACYRFCDFDSAADFPDKD